MHLQIYSAHRGRRRRRRGRHRDVPDASAPRDSGLTTPARRRPPRPAPPTATTPVQWDWGVGETATGAGFPRARLRCVASRAGGWWRAIANNGGQQL
jgi:hypothetical protein